MQRSDEFLRSRRNIFGQLGALRAKSVGPAQKTIYTVVSGKNPFPDVANQRNIPRYAMAQTVLGQMTDQFTADMVMRATNPDYYSPRSSWDSASQLVLQVRRRDPEQWAYYYIRDKATQWKQARHGVSREHGSYDSPDAEALRNFRRSIYAGDVEAAKRLYVRLLGYGYTAQRFEQGIKASGSPWANYRPRTVRGRPL